MCKQNNKRVFFILVLWALAGALFRSSPVSAATPPDSCFAFNSGTGTITEYYDNEGNNGANPACTRDVDIPSTIGGNPVTAIGIQSFQGEDITAVTIPSSVTSISSGAFNLNEISELVIPDSVTSIGSLAFSTNAITSLEIGSGLSSIGQRVFSFNHLVEVDIPDTVTSVQADAFIFQSSASDPASYDDWASLDPPLVQQAYDRIVYARLYTETPSNPNGLVNAVRTEFNFGFDYDSDSSFLDSLGGHLINPAQVTLRYEDTDGNTLQADTTHTGSGLSNYRAVENTGNDLNLYYLLGDDEDFSAPPISGYIAPGPTTIALTQVNNTYTFVYTALPSDPVDVDDSTTSETPSGELATSGAMLLGIAGLAAILIIGGGLLIRRKPRRK